MKEIKEINFNNMVAGHLALANFYMEENEAGKPRWHYMDKSRMVYIFEVCIRKLEASNKVEKIQNILNLIKQSGN